MKNEILIFQHSPTEGPGTLAAFLDRHRLRHRTIEIDRGEAVPQSIAGVAGLVFMGGPMSVNDPLPWVPKSLNLIRQAVAADVPVLGHCLGGQLMSKALGGRVRRALVKEIGWLPVDIAPGLTSDGWLTGLPPRFEVFHWHGETFSIPPGATHLLRSRHCRNQGFVLGKHLALQCHIEMTADMVRSWSDHGAKEIAMPTATVQRRAQMLMHLPQRVARLQDIADRLYTRWIKGLKR